jgi:hypothetical protein
VSIAWTENRAAHTYILTQESETLLKPRLQSDTGPGAPQNFGKRPEREYFLVRLSGK